MNITIQELADLAAKIGKILTRLEIPFFLTGGIVASFYGEQRMTQDVDMVINLAGTAEDTRNTLLRELEKHFMVSRSAFDEAVTRKRMFQVLDLETMLRADIYVGGMSLERFDRAVSVEIVQDTSLPIASPEDSILSKLVWIKKGSGRSKQDVVAILRIQTELDTEYLDATAKKLGVDAILEEMRQIADRNDPHEIY